MTEKLAFGEDGPVERAATISHGGVYRYDLSRNWGEGGTAVFVLLNPSTADQTIDDPTVAAVTHFATSLRSHRIGRLTIVNLFALRATDPTLLRSHPDPVGPENDETIARHLQDADAIVVGWGEQGANFRDRVRTVLELLAQYQPWCLGTTIKGQPRHPQRLSPLNSACALRLGCAGPGGHPSHGSKGRSGPDRGRGVAGFSQWLRARGWQVETEVEWADVVATRRDERLVAEAKGSTLAPNLDIDTAYGQLLRRMSDDRPDIRYAIVVPERFVAGALRVPETIRRTLRLDVYGVDDVGNVTVHPGR